jgi:hypothetical protein
MYMALKGDVLVADRDASGNPGAFSDLLEVELLEINVEVDYLSNETNNSKVAERDLHVERKRIIDANLTIKESTAANLALALHSEVVSVTGGSFSAAAFPSGVQTGETHQIPGGRSKVTSLVITDSAGSPATLVAGTNYTADADFGLVTFTGSLSGFTQPFKAAGTESALKKAIGLLTKKVSKKYVLFKGYNIADEDKRVCVRLFNCSFMPAKQAAIGNKGEISMYEMQIGLVADKTKSADTSTNPLGRYGQYELLEP